ncbi:DUF6221 family protein [Nocardia asiatica]|uniref:DUF6221 family protein n=1 Tax=Nocardia asiatica TaxID=209252 RepID=UPI000316D3AB|nr:DUF6221 family protein [Nocardia asiatica]
MTDPLSRLRAGLAEDERIARAATPGPWRHNPNKHHRLEGMPLGSGHAFEEAVFAGPTGADAVCVAGTGDSDDPQSMQDAEHIARQSPKATLDRVEAIRDNVIAPYLAAVAAVEATVSARRYAASRHTLAALRLDHGGGDAMEERRTREELLSAEVQLASDAAKRDAYASVVAALASIYPEGGCEHPDITLEDRTPIGDFLAYTYHCESCGYTVIINRVAGDEPTEDEIRRAFYPEPTETGDTQ